MQGVEYNGYGGKNTQVESGLGASTVTIQQFSDPAYIIKVSVTYGTLKHYLFVRYKNDNVYIFTNKADASVTVHRYIVRMKGGSFSYSSSDSDFYPDGSSFIEASDVSGLVSVTFLLQRIPDFHVLECSRMQHFRIRSMTNVTIRAMEPLGLSTIMEVYTAA